MAVSLLTVCSDLSAVAYETETLLVSRPDFSIIARVNAAC